MKIRDASDPKATISAKPIVTLTFFLLVLLSGCVNLVKIKEYPLNITSNGPRGSLLVLVTESPGIPKVKGLPLLANQGAADRHYILDRSATMVVGESITKILGAAGYTPELVQQLPQLPGAIGTRWVQIEVQAVYNDDTAEGFGYGVFGFVKWKQTLGEGPTVLKEETIIGKGHRSHYTGGVGFGSPAAEYGEELGVALNDAGIQALQSVEGTFPENPSQPLPQKAR